MSRETFNGPVVPLDAISIAPDTPAVPAISTIRTSAARRIAELGLRRGTLRGGIIERFQRDGRTLLAIDTCGFAVFRCAVLDENPVTHVTHPHRQTIRTEELHDADAALVGDLGILPAGRPDLEPETKTKRR